MKVREDIFDEAKEYIFANIWEYKGRVVFGSGPHGSLWQFLMDKDLFTHELRWNLTCDLVDADIVEPRRVGPKGGQDPRLFLTDEGVRQQETWVRHN
jgi:hypothetical protein